MIRPRPLARRAGKCGPARVQRGEQRSLEAHLPMFRGELVEVLPDDRAHVVHEDVESSRGVHRAPEAGLDCGRVGEIERDAIAAATVLLDLCDDFEGFVLAAVIVDDHVRAGLGEGQRESPPGSERGARHEGDAAF